MNTATTRSTANGVARQVTGRAASTRLRANIGTAPAATNASGVVPPPTAPAVSTAQPESMRSNRLKRLNTKNKKGNEMSNEKSTEFGSWTLHDILEGRYFRVPDYQRGYAWSNRQLEEFWEDLCAVEKAGGRHYTGAITVEELPDISEFQSRKGFEVVDGQQRLTTVAILLSVLSSDDSPFIMKEQGGVHYVFSYGENNDDLQFLRDILSGNELGSPENSHQRNLKNAREFFQAKTDELSADQKREIAEVVMSRLTFDFRILGSDYNAGVIFETMNNRGKPLTLLEKLKNRLMYLTSTLSVDGDEESNDIFEDEKASLREEIEEAWGSIYRLLASNPQSDPLDEDEFIAAHLSVYRAPKESVYSKTVAESRLFKMFSANAECHPKSERIDENDKVAVAKALREEGVSIEKIRDYVEDLVNFAEPWATLHETFDGALGRCRLLSGTQEVNVFLAAILCHVGEEETRESIFEKAELILFRNTIRSVMDEATFATLARRLHGKCLDMLKKGDNEQIDAKGIEDLLHAIVDDEKRQLNVAHLVDYFAGLMDRQQSPYGFYGWTGLKYFLFKLEDGDGLEWNRFDDTTLEHILPQSATSDNDNGWWVRQVQEFVAANGYGNWDTLSDKERKACRQCKRNLVNSLGNFVLLTQSENASVSDDPWESYPAVEGVHKSVVGKKAFYSDSKNVSSSGARCVASANGSWNAFRIRERGRDLFKKLVDMLGATGDLADGSVDLAIGFDVVKSLEDSSFGALPANEVTRLAPRLGSAAEKQKEPPHETKGNLGNIAFWEAFKKWCLENGYKWCSAAVAKRGNPYYDPQGGGECYIFFTLGEKSGETKGCGPLVTIGIYCKKGEDQRNQIRKFRDDFDKQFSSCKFYSQDWEFGTGTAKRILFVRQADYRAPSPSLFKRMADDYEGILSVMRAHGHVLPEKKWK